MNYDSPSPEGAVGYMGPMFNRLIAQGFQIKSLLDVGAAHGHFSSYFERFFPEAEITAVECNERDAYFLSRYRWDTHYMCLGDKPCKKTFYVDKVDEIGGGSSLYKENTVFFKDCIEEEKEINTIDLAFPGRTFDFIKIDTQGSELDILRGGKDVVSRAQWLLLELSFMEYNQGAPLIDDVLEYTRSIGFRMYDTIGPKDGGHMIGDCTVKLQADVLLKNTRV
jgi:FkbM family methyltransferase